jgi:hypothetical protein
VDKEWTCPTPAGDQTPTPRWITNTTDVLFDITDEKEEIIDWILDTHDDFIDARFVFCKSCPSVSNVYGFP